VHAYSDQLALGCKIILGLFQINTMHMLGVNVRLTAWRITESAAKKKNNCFMTFIFVFCALVLLIAGFRADYEAGLICAGYNQV